MKESISDTFEADSDYQALSILLEACSQSALSPLLLENLETNTVIWESENQKPETASLQEGASLPLKKGETVSFQWKQGDKLYPVQGTIKRITLDWRSNNPAQKYLYQIKLDRPITITIDRDKLLVVKRTSMKGIQKIL